jgi:prepilin-type processing-associated H-X9-DG protein
MPPRSRPSSGFSLVELLVVISLIILLISILMPALAKAREAAAMINCLSNIRQMNMAVLEYTHVSNGWLPIHRFNGYITDPGTYITPEWGYVRHVGWVKRLTELGLIGRLSESPFDPYAKSNVRFCPTMATQQPSKSGLIITGDFGGRQNLAHFAMSTIVTGYTSVDGNSGVVTVYWKHNRLDNIRKPASVYLVTESPWNVDKNAVTVGVQDDSSSIRFRPGINVVGNADETLYWPLLSQVAAWRHQKNRVNFAFADGHTGAIAWQDSITNFGKIHLVDHQ